MVVIASNGQHGNGGFSPQLRDNRTGMTDQQGLPRAAVLIVDDDPDNGEVLTDPVSIQS